MPTQNIIKDFKTQAFAIKATGFGFLGLVIPILNKNHSLSIFLVLILASLVFWIIESFFLQMERIYRKVEEYYSPELGLNYKKYQEKFPGCDVPICSVMFSKTIFPLYLIQFLLIFSVYFG